MLDKVHKKDLTASTEAAIIQALAANVVSYWELASVDQRQQGVAWYTRARDLIDGIAGRTALDRITVAALVAITSPRQGWDQNLVTAENCATVREPVKVMGDQARKIARLFKGESAHSVVSGPKVSRFFRNMLGDLSLVTVDIWALRVLLADVTLGDTEYKSHLGTATRYSLAERAYQHAAELVGEAPAIVQAVTWVVIREGGRDRVMS